MKSGYYVIYDATLRPQTELQQHLRASPINGTQKFYLNSRAFSRNNPLCYHGHDVTLQHSGSSRPRVRPSKSKEVGHSMGQQRWEREGQGQGRRYQAHQNAQDPA